MRLPAVAAVLLFGTLLSVHGHAFALVTDLDCADFGTRESAQHHLNADEFDVDGLDADHDGRACERNPSGRNYAAIAALATALLGIGWMRPRKPGAAKWDSEDYKYVGVRGLVLGIPGGLVGLFLPDYLPRQTTALMFGGIGALVSVVAVFVWGVKATV